MWEGEGYACSVFQSTVAKIPPLVFTLPAYFYTTHILYMTHLTAGKNAQSLRAQPAVHVCFWNNLLCPIARYGLSYVTDSEGH